MDGRLANDRLLNAMHAPLSDHVSDRPVDTRPSSDIIGNEKNCYCGASASAVTRSVPPERLPKLDVAGSNPVGRSKDSGGYGETRSPLGVSSNH